MFGLAGVIITRVVPHMEHYIKAKAFMCYENLQENKKIPSLQASWFGLDQS